MPKPTVQAHIKKKYTLMGSITPKPQVHSVSSI